MWVGEGGRGRALCAASRADLDWLLAVRADLDWLRRPRTWIGDLESSLSLSPPLSSPSCTPRRERVGCVGWGGEGTCLERGGARGLGLAPARAGSAGIPILRTPASARVVVPVEVGWVVP